MAVKFSNNAITTLASAINSTQTTITVTDASKFPTLGAGDYTYVTLDADAVPAVREIVKVTAITGNVFTVVRGQDGTSAASFDAGVFIELRLTAALLNDVADLPLSVSTTTASGGGTLAYSAGVFTFAPADLSSYATQTYVNTAVANLVDSAPATLDTLNELAAALGDDANFSTTVTNSIATKWTQDNTKISNWDTAYSWGDHSSVGYITDLSSFTTTDLAEGTNLYYTNERVDDRVNALIVPGLGITTDYDDTAGTLTIDSDTIEELCKNGTGSTILKGTPVYQTGTAGNAMVIAPADASSAATMPAVGVLSQNLAAEAEGNLILMGRISGVDTSAFSEGDVIYVASGGGYTNVRPTGQSILVQNLGRVTKVHASNGGGVIMGAGRSNDVPNLTDGNIFIGNASGTYDKRAIVTADISDLTATATELNYTDGVTSNIQTQLDTKAPTASPTFTGTVTADGLSLGDNDKAFFGDGSDLQIYHDGSNSYIRENGVGALLIQSNNNGIVFEKTDGENIGYMDTLNSRVVLYNGGSQKLETTSTGIDVTGTATMDGLTVDGGGTLRIDASATTDFFTIIQGGTQAVLTADSPDGAGNMVFRTASAGVDATRMDIASNGDISFYEDTGTTAKLTWDASAESLGIGTSSPANSLHIKAIGADFATMRLDASDNTTPATYLIRTHDGVFDVRNTLNSTTPLTINASGNVGIGTSSPTQALDVSGNMISNGRLILTNTGSSVDTGSVSVGTLAGGFYANTPSGKPIYHAVAGTAITYSDANTHWFKTAGTERLRIDSSGNVGIGTSSPNYSLQVHESSDTTVRFQITNSNTGTGPSDGFQIIQNGSAQSNKVNLLNYENSALGIWTNNTERLHITSSGNVGIGTSSPRTKLSVDAGAADAFLHLDTDSFTGTYASAINFSCNTVDATNYYQGQIGFRGEDNYSGHLFFSTSNSGTTNAVTERMRIDSSGNVNIYGTDGRPLAITSFNTASAGAGWDLDATSISGVVTVSTNGAERMRIDSSGNVGICTTSTTYQLHVRSDDASDDVAYIHHDNASQSSGTLLKVRSDAGASSGYSLLDVQNNSGTALYVAGDNKVGIGTTSPTAKMHILGNGEVPLRWGNTSALANLTYSGSVPLIQTVDQPLAFWISSNEAMRIDSSGRLNVGQTSAYAPAGGGVSIATFEESSNSRTNLVVSNQNSGSSAGASVILASHGADYIIEHQGSGKGGALTFTRGTSEAMRIDSSGNVGIGGTPVAGLHIQTSTRSLSLAPSATGGGGGSYILMGNSDSGGVTGPNVIYSGNRSLLFGVGDNFSSATGGTFSEYMRIGDSGNVGIGTSVTTDAKTTISLAGVAVSGNTDGATIGASGIVNLYNSTGTVTNSTIMLLGSTSSSTAGRISSGIGFSRENSSGWGTQLRFYTHSTATSDIDELLERMRIDASGNVGIGVTDPVSYSSRLVVDGGRLTIASGNRMGFWEPANLGRFEINSPSYHALAFSTDLGSEKMRIDSSGNLLVGTTSAGGSNGITLHTSGYIQPRTNTGIPAIYADREGSDGSIVELRKDGTAVGSIGAKDGDMTIGTNGIGIRFYDGGNGIYPVNASTQAGLDATIDLGRADGGGTFRFKDAYLSGGVYLGGTGAANKLDDYETGTWTPVLEGLTTAGTYTYEAARTGGTYTKIGDTVYLRGVVRPTGTITAGSGQALISGLPFVAGNPTNAYLFPNIYSENINPLPAISGITKSSMRLDSGRSYLSLYDSDTGTPVVTNVTDWDTAYQVIPFNIAYKV